MPDQFAYSTTLTSTTALADQIYTTFFFLASITLSLDSVGVVAMCVVVVRDFKTPKVGLNFVPETGVLGSILGFPLSLAVSPAGTEIDKKLPLIREKLPCAASEFFLHLLCLGERSRLTLCHSDRKSTRLN